MVKVILIVLVLVAVACAKPGKKAKGKDKDSDRRKNSDYDLDRVKDLPCDHEGLFDEEKGLNKDFIKKQSEKGFVYLMGNRAHGRDISRALTGEYPEGLCYFSIACMKMVKTSKGFKQTGFGDQKAIFECKETGSGKKKKSECKATKESSHPKEAAERGDEEAVPIWSDNKAYALYVRCSGKGGSKNAVWSLRGTEHKDVDDKTKEKVLKLISARGFNDEHTVIYPQKTCFSEDEDEATTQAADK